MIVLEVDAPNRRQRRIAPRPAWKAGGPPSTNASTLHVLQVLPRVVHLCEILRHLLPTVTEPPLPAATPASATATATATAVRRRRARFLPRRRNRRLSPTLRGAASRFASPPIRTSSSGGFSADFLARGALEPTRAGGSCLLLGRRPRPRRQVVGLRLRRPGRADQTGIAVRLRRRSTGANERHRDTARLLLAARHRR